MRLLPVKIDSHNNRQTTFIHPLTRKSNVSADGIRCPSPVSYRNDTSFGSNTSTGHEHRKQGGKKSSVGSWVKGPGLRGPQPASVTHKGWLFKQGSDGLQFWKRRWFVLCEYCLYYYKGPEEDKVLGYIPLPSFRICPAAAEDRVFRRHVFKAEHDNTRSYFFAAESKEQMTHWMNALSLASILQRDTSLEESQNNTASSRDRPSLSSVNSSTSPTNHSTENSDSGFDGHNSKRVNPSGVPAKKDVGSRKERPELASIDGKSFDEGSEESRSNNDCLNTSVDSFLLSHPGSRQPFYANAPPKPKRLNTSYESSTPDYECNPSSGEIYSTKGRYSSAARKHQPYPKDRRTPEAYGATSVSLLRDDYEDVYGEQREVVNRKKSRRASQSSLQSTDRHLLEELNSLSTTQDKQLDQISRRYYGEDLRCRQPPPRPHSADFLEYEYKHGGEGMWNDRGNGETMTANQLDIRPKSSAGYHEGDFWSEENYAAKMRESAIYNSYLKGVIGSQRSRGPPLDGGSRFVTNQSRVPPAGASSPDNFRANTNFSPVNSVHSCKSEGPPVKSVPVLQSNGSSQADGVIRKQSFSRSASARLPKNTTHNDTLNSSMAEEFPESDKKREESMKRLLEWKQRMLQSPLTRKSTSRPESSASSNASSSKMNAYHGAYADTSLNKSRETQNIKELKNSDSSGIVSYHKYNPSSAGIRSTKSVSGKKYSNLLSESVPPSHQRPATQGESAPDLVANPGLISALSKGQNESNNLYSNATRGNKTPEPYYSNHSDIAKFGDSFPRRLEYNQQAVSETNSNYGFGQNYISPNRAYDQTTAVHHYKGEESHYASRPPLTHYPYDQERYHDHTYQNYRTHPNDILETVKASPYQNSPTNGTARHSYYNQYRDQDYGVYEYNYLRNADTDYATTEVPYQPPTDLEFSMRGPQSGDPASDLLQPQGLLGGVSAGELLGKTHEELVLLLIQLRRHQSALLAARKHTSLEKESQERLIHLDSERGEEHFTRISYLDDHLVDLDKQYQMGKPLINLVDNMVKLGSLYTGFDSKYSPEAEQLPFGPQDSLEFSRRILERRILDEDRSKFDSVAPNQNDLEEKVMQLYKLERKLGEESLSIQDLQRKKEMLEKTLYDLHRYSYRAKDNAMEVERRSRQRDHMERELSRLRSHLAVSARRLEETAVENNRLEHEMMMLRQKIQSNMTRNLNSASLGTNESQHIESEMLRVQSLLEELQKRRMDLSRQIHRLTSTSEAKTDERFSPTGVSPTQSIKKRNHSTWMETDLDHMITKDRGMEDIALFTSGSFIPSYSRLSSRTDNYNDVTKAPNHTDNSYMSPNHLPVQMNANRNLDNNYGLRMMQGLSEAGFNNNDNFQSNQRNSSYDDFSEKKAYEAGLITELDRNSEGNKPDGEEQIPNTVHIDITEADDRTKRFYGLLPKEKVLEPKTVRVVKRESTERKRDRFPSSKKEVTLSYVDEADSDNSDDTPDSIPSYTSKTASLPRNYNRKGFERLNIARSSPNSSSSVARPNNLPLRSRPSNSKSRSEADCTGSLSDNDQRSSVSAQQRLLEPESVIRSDLPATVFKSAAAQEIVKEMTWEAEKHRRLVPKEKRRHFTISSSKPVTLEAGHVQEEGARSRDDCDMVRALRPRNHPDVVKSTLSTRDVRFNENTIDTLFGAPNKIHIPERYRPDEDDERELTASEKLHRQEKANSIRKMLAESSTSVTKDDNDNPRLGEGRGKSVADKKERERMLTMNQLLAKQVMEKSRMVAVGTTLEGEM